METTYQTTKEGSERLREFGFTINPKKVMAGFRELEFLGHIVGNQEMKPTTEKVENIIRLSAPSTKKEVRKLLGTIGFYKKYISDYSTITAPITDLLKGPKKSPIVWTPDCQKALERLQREMSRGPVLKLPDMEKEFVVRTDASATGVGGVLLQEHDGVLHPVAYVSRKLQDRERRYSTIERECLGLVWTMLKLQRYLWGKQFRLETDHKPLIYLTSSAYQNARIMRWALKLQEFCYTVTRVPGNDNTIADYMSRSERDQVIP